MPRFFVPSVNFSETSVKITGDDARHIARSLRMAEGDSVTICDMHGNEHNCTLTRIRDEECECECDDCNGECCCENECECCEETAEEAIEASEKDFEA